MGSTSALSIQLEGLVSDNQKTIGPLLNSLEQILATLNVTFSDDGLGDTTVDVEIVVPVYNEQHDLGPSVRRLHDFLRDQFPFTYATQTDALTGKSDGLLARCAASRTRFSVSRRQWRARPDQGFPAEEHDGAAAQPPAIAGNAVHGFRQSGLHA